MKKKVLFGVLGLTALAGVIVAIISSIKQDDEDDYFDDLDDLDCFEGYDPEIAKDFDERVKKDLKGIYPETADDYDKRVKNLHKSQGLDDNNFDSFDDLATEKEALTEG